MMSKQADSAVGLKLKVVTTDGQEFFDLRGDAITIGRARDNNLILRDARASRYHARLEQGKTGWSVKDTGSQNGTFVNGRQMKESSLKPGDVVQIGGTRLMLERKTLAAKPIDKTTSCDIQVIGEAAFEDGEDGPRLETLLHLQSVARAMNSELNLETLLNLVIDSAVQMSGAERGFLILMGKGQTEFRVARNFEQETVSAPEFAVSWSIATQVSTTGQSILCVNAAEDDRFGGHESVLALGLRSVMCVPFKVRQRVLGVLYVDNRLHKGAFSRTDFRVLQTLADQGAVALENARLYQDAVEQKVQLERAMAQSDADGAANAVVRPPEAESALNSIIGSSSVMEDLRSLICKVAESDLAVLVRGESGTGKEMVVRAIHEESARGRRAFVGENCCTIPENLLESELFGYTKGAFTGANADKVGLFEAASGGTLFLDEIGDLPKPLQTKLLRVLQEGEIRPVGAKKAIPVNVRLVTATNADLEELIAEGRFREDLYYRVRVVEVELAPLRERLEDLPQLAAHFLQQYAAGRSGEARTLSRAALDLFMGYRWPGNIRELQNEMRNLSALGDGPVEPEDISARISDEVNMLVGDESSFRDLTALVESVETREITKALRRSGGNKTKAAKVLGISRFALQRKMDKYELDSEEII